MDFSKSWLKVGLISSAVAIGISAVGIIPCVGCLVLPISCVAWFIIPLVTGFMSTKLANITNDTGEAAKNGVLAGVVLGIVGGLGQFVISVVGSALNTGINAAMSNYSESSDYYSNLASVPVGIGGAIICGLAGFIIGLVIDVLLSALGGIIRSATAK